MNSFEEAEKSYSDSGIGSVRMGLGKNPCLLIIDMQNDLTGPWARDCINHNVILLKSARENGIPVFFTQAVAHPTRVGLGLSTFKPLREGKVIVEGTHGVEVIPELAPIEGEYIIRKRRPSAFFGTDLEIFLKSLNVDTIVTTGVTTSGCVRCTITDAFMRDYPVIVPRECVGEQSKTVHENNLFDIQAKFGEVMSTDKVIDYLASRPKLATKMVTV